MKKLILILLAFMLIVGCRAKTNLKNKDVYQSKVENTVDVKAEVTKVEKKDSLVIVKEKKEEKNTSTGIKVVFDPKKNDSLEVTHVIGKDSLHLKIRGNGVVTLDYRQETKVEEKTDNKIFGSATLFRIDSTLSGKSTNIINTKAVTTRKKVKSTGFDFGTYIIIGICAVVLLILWFIWMKFGNRFTDWFNNRKNN